MKYIYIEGDVNANSIIGIAKEIDNETLAKLMPVIDRLNEMQAENLCRYRDWGGIPLYGEEARQTGVGLLDNFDEATKDLFTKYLPVAPGDYDIYVVTKVMLFEAPSVLFS